MRSDFNSGRAWAVRFITPIISTTGAPFGCNIISAISPRGTMRFIIAIIGCELWAHEKNRSWLFALWGLVAPIGYLVMASLKDKTLQ